MNANHQYHENNQQENHYNYNNNNNYNNRHTDPGVSEEVMLRIGRLYLENIAPKITGVAAGIIEDALKDFDPDTVILAIEECGMAPRPSPYYLRGILRNWKEHGVTVSAPHSKGKWWQNPALQYEQRDYSQMDEKAFFTDLSIYDNSKISD